MYIIDCPFHIIFSNDNEEPIFACVTKCKKSWWQSDIETPNTCPLCKGELCEAVKDVHFRVLNHANRDLKYSDFKRITTMPNQDKHHIKEWLAKGAIIANLGMVKPAFEAKAKAEWC